MSEMSQLPMEMFVQNEWKDYLSTAGPDGGNTKEFLLSLPAKAEEAHREGWLSLDLTPGDLAVRRFRELDQKQTSYIDPILDSAADGQLPFIGQDDPVLDFGFKTGPGKGGRKMLRYLATEDIHDMLAREAKNLESAQLAMERAEIRASRLLAILQRHNTFEAAYMAKAVSSESGSEAAA